MEICTSPHYALRSEAGSENLSTPPKPFAKGGLEDHVWIFLPTALAVE